MTDGPSGVTRHMVGRYLETDPVPELADVDKETLIAEVARRGLVDDTPLAGMASRLAELMAAAATLKLVQGSLDGLSTLSIHRPPPGVHVPAQDAAAVGEQLALGYAVPAFTDEQCRLYLLLRDQGRTRREALTALEGVFGIRLLVDGS